MSTREQTRRELQDLAKLAAGMPKEHSTSAPPPPPDFGSGGLSPSRVTVPPAIASVPPPPLVPSLPSSLAPQPAPGPTTRPPRSSALFASQVSGWRGGWALFAGGALAAAMIGGLLLGQSLASHASATATRAPSAASGERASGVAQTPPNAPASTEAPAPPPPATAAATAEAPAAAEATAANAAEPVLAVTAAPAVVRAPRPAHHAVAPRAPVVAPPAASAAPKAAAPAKAPAGHDALDDLIRKAASGK